jgi:hypothetical protein
MTLEAGFAKVDITPRVGVELAGFGPFLCRKSVAIRDRLWAKAMAVRQGPSHFIVVSCDLLGLGLEQTRLIRHLIGEKIPVAEKAIMVHCTHTHSGPSTGSYTGWGEPDVPYLELLPHRIAQACIDAWNSLAPVTVAHAEVPCEGIGLNREYDRDAPPLNEVLNESWRPAKPELTDTTCQVITFTGNQGRRVGFASYFGCHPVVCCQEARHIHGDYPGVAMNLLEREQGGIGLFLQGAQGDVNSCCVHKPENDSLLALDIIASRFAKSVRHGLGQAKTLAVDKVSFCLNQVSFTRKPWDVAVIRKLLAERESRLNFSEARDDVPAYRMEMVYIEALRKLLARAGRGEPLAAPTEIQAVRLGPITIVTSGFETFQAIKNEVLEARPAPITLVTGLSNDVMGYAPDRTKALRGGYAVDEVPFIVGQLPYERVYEELPRELIRAARQANA